MAETKSNGLKYIFMGLVVTAFLCFVMGGVTLRREIARWKQHPVSTQPPPPARRSPFSQSQATPKIYPSSPARPTEPVKPLATWQPPPAQVLGKWQGGGATATGFFFFTIEISPDTRNPSQLLAYVRTLNMALPLPALGKRQPNVAELIAQRVPHQLSLVGVPSDDGSVAFHVLQAIGPQGDCPIADIRVSTWGTEGIAAEWKGAACPGGSLVLTRQP